MTWEQLAAQIAQMTPEQRTQPVRFAESYDSFKIHTNVEFLVSEHTFSDSDGTVIQAHQPYLG